MLERNWPAAVHWQESDQRQELITLSDILAFVRRYFFSIAAFALVGLLLASAYLLTSDPIYSTQTQVLIEPKLPQNVQQRPTDINLSLDTSQIESEMALMRSQKIALMVVKSLDLANNPDFMNLGRLTIAERFRRLWYVIRHGGRRDVQRRGSLPPMDKLSEAAAAKRLQDAVAIFRANLNVAREGVSYAIDISFQALAPALSAKIANEIANAFVREQQDTQKAAAGEATSWLERRIKEVGEQMNAATRLVQEFHAQHNYGLNEHTTIEDTAGILGKPDTKHRVTLEQLQVSEDTYRKMYESLLGAYTSSMDRQPYAFANARVITSAAVPEVEARPRKKLVLAFGLLVGLISGIGLAVARRSLDRTVRSPRQIQEEIGVPCLSELPTVHFHRSGFGRLDEVLRRPDSLFAWNLRNVRLAIDLADGAGKTRLVGVTSVSPGDGKGTVVSNLAGLYAAAGVRTLVIGTDRRSALESDDPMLQGSADQQESPILAERKLLAGRIVNLKDRLFDYFQNEAGSPQDLLVASNMKQLVDEVLEYDVMIVDLPTFSFGPDALAVSSLLDCVIVVSDCGRTSLSALGDLVRTLRNAKANVLGVLMTRTRSVSVRGHRSLTSQTPR